MRFRRRPDVLGEDKDDGLSRRERELRRDRDRLEAALDAEAAARTARIEAANAELDAGTWEAPEPPDEEQRGYVPMSAHLRGVKRALGHPFQR